MKAPASGRFNYYKDDSKTDRAYRGDYYTLGDVGYLDEDGYLYLTDRSAHLIISGGVNIYPAEAEGVLFAHPAVADVGVIGVPDSEWGEAVKAVVIPQPGYTPSPQLARGADRLLPPAPGSFQMSAQRGLRRRAAAPRQRQAVQAQAARDVSVESIIPQSIPMRRGS